ncbi:SGNH/GDSL hydrolase family protein [Oscillatoria sp. HE19RPO]|uniref:SGNH/GDSL hydrolase family protein n=1 Tax=Oscillatoria sp. HE19RPO TaxID=2954806 RepID=UPI0020C3BD41|nr:SGNH/GDSL hydrolase family protein [Oscillatoria sp. HE19RPO]
MKMIGIAIAIILGLFIAVEVALRLLFGFGNPPLYIPDEKIGYLLAPNQKLRRFGNRFEINQYSMRSAAVTPTSDTPRVLLLGDSVANGGWWTDQAQTISAFMQQQLPKRLPGNSPQIEVLNASANSWGPRNERAYLEKFGTFGAKAVVLLINTDDLFGTQPSSIQVGRDRNYPDKKPPLALVEVVSRYLLPAPTVPKLPEEQGDRVGFNLAAIHQIQQIVTETQGQFLLAITPLLRELGEPGPRDYEIKARQRLQEFTQQHQITYLDFLDPFNAVEEPASLYRDHIHLSPSGNELVTGKITEALAPMMSF